MRDLKSCRVLVTPTTYGICEPYLRAELESTVGEVVYNDLGRPLSSHELRLRLQGIDGYIAGLDAIDRASMALTASRSSRVMALALIKSISPQLASDLS